MILSLLKTNRNVIVKMFNAVLLSDNPITAWNTSIISPIHKKGSKTNPDNYRAISLTCCLNKFYSAVLNQRLLKFTIEQGIIRENQLGFMPGNRTSDALVILYNLINRYCTLNSKYIYACFVDFKKAFDSIPRHTLFEKLLKFNINGKFFNSIKNMYSNDTIRVNIGNNLTKAFSINQGVKQGCILSPLLFNIFLSDLPESIGKGDCKPVYIDVSKPINSLIWADDLLILSESEHGLCKMLKNLEDYTSLNTIKVNLDKTKCMIFNKTGRLIGRSFWYSGKKLEVVREYKYLGFLITPSMNLHAALKDLRDRGLGAYGSLKTKLGELFKRHPLTTIQLFESLVKHVLLYASDFWGCLKLPKNNPIESLHLKFCKNLLGVGTYSTNFAVLLELGRIPLNLFAEKNAAKNWERILREDNKKLVKISYDCSNATGWSQSIENCFSRIGLHDIHQNSTIQLNKLRSTILFNRKKIYSSN